MRKYQEAERIRIIENFQELSNVLSTKVGEESKKLAELYERQIKAETKFTEIEVRIKELLEHLEFIRSECVKEQKNIDEQKVDLGKRESAVKSFNDNFVVEKKKRDRTLEELDLEIVEKKKVIKDLVSKFGKMASDISSGDEKLEVILAKSEEIKKKIDSETTQFDKVIREKDVKLQKLNRDFDTKTKEFIEVDKKLQVDKEAFSKVKGAYIREEQVMKRKRKDLAILARRITEIYQKHIPGFKFRV